MKKTVVIFLISTLGFAAIGQTKTEKYNLNKIKNFYTKLEKIGIDTKQELVWEYTYSDTSEVTLNKLARVLEKEDLKSEEVKLSTKVAHTYDLKVTELKKYKTPESFNERVDYLNSVANIFKISEPEAKYGASTLKKETEINSYKKMGKNSKK